MSKRFILRLGMVSTLLVFLGALLLLGAGALLAGAADDPQDKPQKGEKFAAWAVNLGGAGSAIKSGQVMITIERWSTPEERQQLVDAFSEGGQGKLFEVLTKMPGVGYIRLPTQTDWAFHYAYQFPTGDGGRKIIIATNRKVGFQGAYSYSRSIDYPFELIQMKLDAEDKGEGKVSFAVTFRLEMLDGSGIELGNDGTIPAYAAEHPEGRQRGQGKGEMSKSFSLRLRVAITLLVSSCSGSSP